MSETNGQNAALYIDKTDKDTPQKTCSCNYTKCWFDKELTEELTSQYLLNATLYTFI